ncbi:hypothetical protein [Novosphingobium aromaticivorans]|uniref:hypothetical protein n=1 Tax=Novosphingobium aromaticivorans TaxID=48935 RepID=UPI00115F937B|nr:hypothetical protein [Novosphingobium aromaticivorans]
MKLRSTISGLFLTAAAKQPPNERKQADDSLLRANVQTRALSLLCGKSAILRVLRHPNLQA